MWDKQVSPLRPDVKNIPGIYVCIKSVVVEHSIEWCHQIKFRDIEVLAKTAGYMDQLIKEAREIGLHPDNINKEEGFKLSQTLNPAIKILQTNGMGNTNNTRCGRFRNDREKQRQANIGQKTEDHAPG
jgi:hypothetical protein